MIKKIIRLTESDLHRLVKESVQIILEGKLSSYFSKFEAEQLRLQERRRELFDIDDKITRNINRLKKIMKDYPDEAHLHEKELNDLIAQRDEIRREKAEIRAKVKQIQDERNKKLSPSAMRARAKAVKDALEPTPTLPGRDVVPRELWDKRSKSRREVKQIERNNWVEERYNEILTNGYLLVPKAKEVTVTSGGKRHVTDLAGLGSKKFDINKFKKYVENNHPEKIVKATLIPRKRERGQLDDVEYYDMKVFLEDNPNFKPSTPNPNAIHFSPEDVPAGRKSIHFSPEDVPDYTY